MEHIVISNHNQDQKLPRVGVIIDERGDPPYVSVNRLWVETTRLISQRFPTSYYRVNSYEIDARSDAFVSFSKNIDVLLLMSPYYQIDRAICNVPAIVFALGSLQKGGHWLRRNLQSFRSYDSLITNSTACYRIYQKIVQSPFMVPYLVPFGIDTTTYRPYSDKSSLRAKYGIPQEKTALVYSGRINIQKNCLNLLSVFHMLKNLQDAILVFVGFFDDFYIPEFAQQPPLTIKEMIYKQIHEFGINNDIIFLEHQSSAYDHACILSACDIGINLSTLISENFGFTQVEMQACGLPVVAADWGGLRDTVKHNTTGFKVQTILTDCGVRFSEGQAVAYLQRLLTDRQLYASFAEEAVINGQQYSLARYQDALTRVINETAQRTTTEGIEPVLHPTMAHFYKTQELSNKVEHISSDHLYPVLDLEHYRFVLAECCTKVESEVQWVSSSIVDKAFRWRIDLTGGFYSQDVHWNMSLASIKSCQLSEQERAVLVSINDGICAFADLEKLFGDRLVPLLKSLTRKGIILPHT